MREERENREEERDRETERDRAFPRPTYLPTFDLPCSHSPFLPHIGSKQRERERGGDRVTIMSILESEEIKRRIEQKK